MALLLLLVFGLVCHGWGRCVSFLCYRHKNGFAFEIALGLAALSALGGWLNAFGLAKAPALYTLCAVGAALWLNSARKILPVYIRSLPTVFSEQRIGWPEVAKAAPYALMCLAAAFFCLTLMPTAAFNFADDMHTYLVRPFRMLATGTVGRNPFDMLGLDSLGAQSFFQSFMLLQGPVTWINGFDVVFCFAISGFLILEIARQSGLSWRFSMVAILTFISINPQVVNISSVYSGGVMILGVFVAGWKLVSELDRDNGSSRWKTAIPLALFAAALLALKNTFVLLVGIQLPLFLAWLIVSKTRRTSVLLSVSIVVTIAVALVPWAVVTLGTYGFPGNSMSPELFRGPLAAKYPSLAAHDIKGLFRVGEVFYGGNQLTYNLLALSLAVCAGAALLVLRLRRSSQADETHFCRPAITSFVPLGIAAFVAYILNADLNDTESATRYSCPFLLPLVPLGGLVIGRLVAITPSSPQMRSITLPAFLARIAPVLFQIAVVALFAPTSLHRLELALDARTIISFPIDQRYLEYNVYALGRGGLRAYGLQRRIAEGETVLAWVAQPFHLDYRRNKVLNVCNPGLINPWLRFPAGIGDTELRQYLRARGVRYVLFQSDGPGVITEGQLTNWLKSRFPLHRKMGDYSVYSRAVLQRISATSRILYRDEEIVLFELGAEGERLLTEK